MHPATSGPVTVSGYARPVNVRWIAVGPNVAFAQWEVDATLATGESRPDDYTGVNKYEFNEKGQLKATTGLHLFPGMIAKFAESSLDL